LLLNDIKIISSVPKKINYLVYLYMLYSINQNSIVKLALNLKLKMIFYIKQFLTQKLYLPKYGSKQFIVLMYIIMNYCILLNMKYRKQQRRNFKFNNSSISQFTLILKLTTLQY